MGKQKSTKKKHNDFLFLARHVKFSWLFIILAVIATVVSTSITAKIPDITAQLFDGNFEMSRLWDVVKISLLTTVISLISFIFRLIAETRSTLAARNSAWEYMLNTRSEYYDSHDPGSLLSLVSVDAQTLACGLVQMCVFFPQLFTLVLSSAAILMGYSPKLLMVFWVIIPMHLIYMFIVGRWQMSIGKRLSIQIGHLSGYLAERIRNLTMIKSFAAEDKEKANGSEVCGKLYAVNKSYSWLSVVLGAFNSFSNAVSTVITVLWGCFLLRNGEIDLPSFIGFTMYIGVINITLWSISTVWTFVKDFQGRAYRMARLIEADREDDKHSEGVTDIPDGDISVSNLSFAYPNIDKNILSNISFTVPQGKVTAIVGPSGSGKTTLIKLFERLYVPTKGSICVGGQDISSFNLKDWRCKLAYVVQDAGVFGGTLKEALCYGSDKEVSDVQLMDIVSQVGLGDFVESLPDKLDTMLASWGGSLSGGQRQRIVIARALLQDADILIFDEPTSALDPETANAISAMILEKFKGKTVIIISHELNYISAADHIVVINQGKMEAAGGHSILMNTCDVYRALVEEQSYQEVFGA